jgi:hypothetical protein
MKQVLFAIIASIINFSILSAHEDPAKTIKEKQIKEKDRKEIMSLKIQSYTVWNNSVTNGTPGDRKEKYLVTKFDKKGNIASMSVFKTSDSLDYMVVFTYDKDNNMITDTDYNPSGKITEDIKFFYDEKGRVNEQFNYLSDRNLDSKFAYVTDNKNSDVIFTKYKPLEVIEYQIIYNYYGSVDNGNNIEILKQGPDGKLIMRVENVFDKNNQRTYKKIFDENNKMMYYFEYTYDKETGKLASIDKKSSEGNTTSRTTYTYNIMGQTDTVKTFNESGQLTSFMKYSYDHFK